MVKNEKMVLPSDVAKYFLLRTEEDGELVSPLKMQKLVYFAYAHHLAETKKRLFNEKIEAWPLGPVVRSLYDELKKYGSSPIDVKQYTGITSSAQATKFVSIFDKDTLGVLNKVYDGYQTFTPFELVTLAHRENAWLKAREGLKPDENGSRVIKDADIIQQYA